MLTIRMHFFCLASNALRNAFYNVVNAANNLVGLSVISRAVLLTDFIFVGNVLTPDLRIATVKGFYQGTLMNCEALN